MREIFDLEKAQVRALLNLFLKNRPSIRALLRLGARGLELLSRNRELLSQDSMGNITEASGFAKTRWLLVIRNTREQKLLCAFLTIMEKGKLRQIRNLPAKDFPAHLPPFRESLFPIIEIVEKHYGRLFITIAMESDNIIRLLKRFDENKKIDPILLMLKTAIDDYQKKEAFLYPLPHRLEILRQIDLQELIGRFGSLLGIKSGRWRPNPFSFPLHLFRIIITLLGKSSRGK